jgi:hypothetical protein
VAPELADGTVVTVSELSLPGYSFFLLYRRANPKLTVIRAFLAWAQTQVSTPEGGAAP